MIRTLILALTGCVALAAAVLAAEPIVYPAKGQSEQQQEQDQFECHEWATKDTGVDPVALAEQKLGTPSGGQKEGMGGSARGAAVGAAGGAMEGDAAAGAARGVGIGRMVSVLRAKRQLREQQSANESEAASTKAQLDKYDRAYAACLTGRGYTVK
jgi:hypothetical protein